MNQPSEKTTKLLLVLFEKTTLPRILKEVEKGELQLSGLTRKTTPKDRAV